MTRGAWDLTPEQRAIVEAPHGSIFVAAAAGVGKTRVLTARFVAMVLGDGPHPGASIDQIATVTYTDKAAAELAERIRGGLIGRGRITDARQLDRAWISTIHGMCARVLRRHAFEAGVDPHFRIITGTELNAMTVEAMERAIRTCVGSDESCEQLLTALGASRVMQLVSGLYADVRSMDITPAELVIASKPEPRGLLSKAAEIQACAEDLRHARHVTGTVQEDARALDKAAQVMKELAAEDDPGCAEMALAALGRLSVKLSGGLDDDTKNLVMRGQGLLKEAQSEVVASICHGLETALREMVVSFDRVFSGMKDDAGVVDFEDLQLKTAALMSEHAQIAQHYRSSFQELMIDEFQDTNALQLKVATLIAGDELVTVGDDKQSIYRFRHADVEIFRARMAEAGVRKELTVNWRTHPAVLDPINALFASAEFFGDDFMRIGAAREEEGTDDQEEASGEQVWPRSEDRVRLIVVDPGGLTGDDKRRAEAEVLARELRRLADAGVPQKEMAVLLRAVKGRSEHIEAALRAHGLEVYVARAGAYFEQPEVTDALMFLRVVDNPLDDEAFMEVLASPLTGLSDDALSVLCTRDREAPVWVRTSDALPDLEPGDAALLTRTREVVALLRTMRGKMSVSELLHKGCELLEYDVTLFASGPSGPRAWANILKLGRIADEFDRLTPGDLSGFLDYVQMRRSLEQDEQATLVAEDVDAVKVMSIHSAKGLEFGVVALPDLASSYSPVGDVLLDRHGPSVAMRLPSSLVPDGNARSGKDSLQKTERFRALEDREKKLALEESKRLFYVACTRAKEALIWCGSSKPDEEATGTCMLSRVRRTLGIGAPGQTGTGRVEFGGRSIPVEVVTGVLAEAGPAAPVAVPACEVGELPPLEVLFTGAPRAGEGSAPTQISYSALSLFDECPLRYYATALARLGAGRTMHGEGVRAREFGTAAHAALQLALSGLLTHERLGSLAVAHGLTDEDRERLARVVDDFTRSALAARVRSAPIVLTECPICVGIKQTLLVGRIDLLARYGSDWLVVDYKTGRGEKAADQLDRYREQAGCYALAGLRDGARTVEVVFVEVERGCAETRFEFDAADAATIEQRIASRLEAMAAGEFPARDAYSPEVCAECPALGGLCRIRPPAGSAAVAGRTPR